MKPPLMSSGTLDGGAIYLRQNVSLLGTLSQIFNHKPLH